MVHNRKGIWLAVLLAAVMMAALISVSWWAMTSINSLQDNLASSRDAEHKTAVLLRELTLEHTRLTSDHADLTIERDGLQTDKTSLEFQVSVLNADALKSAAQIGLLTDDKTTLTSDLQSAFNDNDELQTINASLTQQLQDEQKEHFELRKVAGEVDMLETQAGALRNSIDRMRTQIASLEEQRRPLVLSSTKDWLACTGSMEPAMTCLDEVEWLDNPRPEDIVPGAIISFDPDCSETLPDGIRTAHRVMGVKEENGTLYYWPQGDNNDDPDGCWVKFGHVKGYVIGIQKDVFLENARLRDMVLEADRKLEDAEQDMMDAWEKYAEVFELECGYHPDSQAEGQTCYVAGTHLNQINRLWSDYEHAYAVYEGAFDHWECAQTSAENALHFEDGRAPFYKACFYIPPLRELPPPPTLLPPSQLPTLPPPP